MDLVMKKIVIILLCNLLLCCFAYAGIEEAKTTFEEAKAAFEAKNYTVAFTKLKPLAEQGYSNAQYNLAHMYQDGIGTPENNERAVFWYTMASEQGHSGAQFSLGIIYYNGRIVKENTVLGFALVATAATNGDALAIDFVKHMSSGDPRKISRAQVLEAQKLSQQLLISRDYLKTIKDYFKIVSLNSSTETFSKNELKQIAEAGEQIESACKIQVEEVIKKSNSSVETAMSKWLAPATFSSEYCSCTVKNWTGNITHHLLYESSDDEIDDYARRMGVKCAVSELKENFINQCKAIFQEVIRITSNEQTSVKSIEKINTNSGKICSCVQEDIDKLTVDNFKIFVQGTLSDYAEYRKTSTIQESTKYSLLSSMKRCGVFSLSK